MSADPLLEDLRARSSTLPAGVRERLWRRLAAPQPRKTHPLIVLFAGASAAAAGALLAIALWKAPVYRSDGFALVGEPGTTWRLEGARTVVLERGAASGSAWSGGPLTVRAGRHVVVAEGAVFGLKVAADQIALDLREGELLLDGERLIAPLRRGQVSTKVARLREHEAADVDEARAWTLAQSVLARGDFPAAARRFAGIGANGGLRAEAGLLSEGDIELRKLNQPSAARETYERLLHLFPDGALRAEAQLSAIEASLLLRDWAQVRDRARSFTAEHPGNERSDEVRWVAARAASELGDTAGACAMARTLDAAKGGALGRELRRQCERR